MTRDELEIRRLEQLRCQALTSGDVGALRALLAEDLVHIHGSGQVEDLSDYLNGVETKFVFERIERGDLDIRIHGDCAIVVGTLDQTVALRGTQTRKDIKALVSQTWVRGGGGWKQTICHMHFQTPA
jgi:ketosteroid isomerase-like protein